MRWLFHERIVTITADQTWCVGICVLLLFGFKTHQLVMTHKASWLVKVKQIDWKQSIKRTFTTSISRWAAIVITEQSFSRWRSGAFLVINENKLRIFVFFWSVGKMKQAANQLMNGKWKQSLAAVLHEPNLCFPRPNVFLNTVRIQMNFDLTRNYSDLYIFFIRVRRPCRFNNAKQKQSCYMFNVINWRDGWRFPATLASTIHVC